MQAKAIPIAEDPVTIMLAEEAKVTAFYQQRLAIKILVAVCQTF
jgi:hypothetical protein